MLVDTEAARLRLLQVHVMSKLPWEAQALRGQALKTVRCFLQVLLYACNLSALPTPRFMCGASYANRCSVYFSVLGWRDFSPSTTSQPMSTSPSRSPCSSPPLQPSLSTESFTSSSSSSSPVPSSSSLSSSTIFRSTCVCRA